MGSLKKVAYPAEVDPPKIILSKACLLQAGRTRHMKKNSAVSVEKPAEFEDELTALLRKGAQQLLLQAVEAELEVFLEEFGGLYDTKGRKAVVRNGYLLTREILTGLGPVQIRVPRTRDRSGS
jgi:putative transposase